ncbi:sensor histidine kinase [Amnibacterium setariae]|uniref:histidine kinase n=1 Tax=Amnibacterium setariae TaxID=2306585 RepID=A0A3A1U9Y3_9MICO|nr:HAMP domain-containing sensor histidine kinase [Amnibacterium setariae]RIX31049.1 sensor histidine kinase [Amnibacterium setariae]
MRRPVRHWSLRVRLAVGAAAVAAVLLGSLAALVAVQVRDVALESATQLAADDLRPYAVDLRFDPEERPDPSSPGLLILVVDPEGRVAHSSMPRPLAAAVATVQDVGTVRTSIGHFRVVHLAVDARRGQWRLWAARDLTAGDALVGGTMLTLAIGTPVAVVLIGVAAFLIAGAALRPVDRMRASADRLRAEGGAGALPVEGGGELVALGVTLNGLIDDLRALAEHERRVTADAAHELRTPIAVLAAQAELAERRAPSADLVEIRRSVDRLARLADELLVLSRAEGAAAEPTGSSSVADLITEAMAEVDRARLLAGPVVVDLELADGVDETAEVAIDPAAFGRVLANLTRNALAAEPASAVRIRVASDVDALRVEVVDDGRGVPESFLPFAFDRFARPEEARGSGSQGAGLGLALVRRLVERAGGRVVLRNGPDGGAVAEVVLPLQRGRGRV